MAGNAPTPEAIRDAIRAEALAIGFDGVHFTKAALPGAIGERLNEFLEKGRHGDMAWMDTRKEQRANPSTLWPDAATAIVLTMNYGPDSNPMDLLEERSAGVISVYARNKDYHDIIKKRLKRLGRWMAEQYGGAALKVFVDTAPVMEKPLAAQAGAGWQGKHTNLVSREHGSWLFLGVILTVLNLPTDDEERDHCGSCSNCLDICPTNAFPAPYQLDARRCISYLTIEHKGPIPADLRAGIGNRIYGCDDCLSVCPWNKFASTAREIGLQPREELIGPPLEKLAALDDPAFRALFSGSPIKRIGRDRFVRNVLIAIGNSDDETLLSSVLALLGDESAVVRGAAVWALGQLADAGTLEKEHADRSPLECDDSVRAEWEAAARMQNLSA